VPVSVRLPKRMAPRIKDENWDLGQFIFNIVSTGRVPTISDVGPGLLNKMVALMMNQNVVAPTNFFTETEEHTIRQVAEELANE